MNLSAIDLNLLLVLSVVLEERSATRAARRLNVTQSAVSNALARLRELLGDPLVVRSGRGLTPTPRARELAPALSAAVAQLQAVVDGGAAFEPATCTRTFSLACADGQQLADVPRIARALEEEMPRATLRVVSIDTLLATDGLASGEVDVSISPRAAHPGLPFATLYEEDAVGLLRRGHPFRGKVLTRQALSSIPQVDLHVAMGRPGVGNAMAKRAYRAQAIERTVALTVPSFAAAAMVVASTDWLVCMPRRVAGLLAEHLPLRVVELPLPRFVIELALVWHARTDQDPAARHLRALIVRTLGAAPLRSRRPAARSRRRGS